MFAYSLVIVLLWSLLTVTVHQAIQECTPDPLCPSSLLSEVTSCTVSDDGTRSTIWSGNSTAVFGCSGNQIGLSHGVPNHISDCLPATARLAPPNGNIYTSTLSVTLSLEMDGALIRCYYPTINNLIEECVLNITNPPSHPGCVSADIERVVNSNNIDSSLVTLSWSAPPSEGPITGYSILISPPLASYPSECGGTTSPCNVSSDVTSLQFNFSLSTPYTISVSTMNCDNQLQGEPSEFGVNLEVPEDVHLDALAVIYDQSRSILKTAHISWSPTGSTTGGITGCGRTLIDGDVSGYAVDVIGTDVNNISSELVPCCNYTYSPIVPSSQDTYNVAVSAVNAVGHGRRTQTPLFRSSNDVLTVSQTVMANNEPNVTVTCHFSSRFQGSSCEITLRIAATDQLVSVTRGQDGVPIQLAVGFNCNYIYTAAFSYSESGINITTQIEGQFTTCDCTQCRVPIVTPAGSNTGGVIAVSVLVPSVVMFISGLLLGLLIMYCVMRNKMKAAGGGDGADHQQSGPGGPVYDEVSPSSVKTEKFEMGENMAYGPTAVRR